MMDQAISVNGQEIPAAEIAAEMQYHPATSAQEAWREAARALAIRTLLLQEADRRDLSAEPEPDEGVEEARIRVLLADAVTPAPIDAASCEHWYESHRHRYRGQDVYEAAHILIEAPASDKAARQAARSKAQQLIDTLNTEPSAFAALAATHSACASAQAGGQLGQMTRGDLVEEVETFIMALEPGQICPVPVMSRFGAHVLRLDRREAARDMPFATARPMVEKDLQAVRWQRGVSAFIHQLAEQATLEGVEWGQLT